MKEEDLAPLSCVQHETPKRTEAKISLKCLSGAGTAVFLFLLAVVTLLGEVTSRDLLPKLKVLHAVPDDEHFLINGQLPTSTALFSKLFQGAPSELYGVPEKQIQEAEDFIPQHSTPTRPSASPATIIMQKSVTEVLTGASPGGKTSPDRLPASSSIDPSRFSPEALSGSVPLNMPGKWAFELTKAVPGSIMLANGTFPGQSYFEGAVILLLKVCRCHKSMFGVILNSPSAEKMESAFCPNSRLRYPLFRNETIYRGGPVGPKWTVLQNFSTGHAYEVTHGIFAQSVLSESHTEVMAAQLSPLDVKFIAGYSAWPLFRLDQEVADRKWRVVKASGELLSSPPSLLYSEIKKQLKLTSILPEYKKSLIH